MPKDKMIEKAENAEMAEMQEKVNNPEKAEKPKKVKKSEKPKKVKKSEKAGKPDKAEKPKGKKARKPEELKGITSVDLKLGLADEPASCAFEPATGHLTLRIPLPLDGHPGAQGPQGPRGPEGATGLGGAAGLGLDLSRAPGDADAFFLFVDEAGRLAYSADGTAYFVSLTPAIET